MVRQSGYYRFPTIQGNQIVFVCEDDLWSVAVEGGIAVRLTSNLGEVSHPFLSPDGTGLAFIGREEGNREVYWMPAEGGAATRLTFLGAMTSVVGWSPDGQSILFASNSAQPFGRIFNLYQIRPEGGMPERLPFGLAHTISYGSEGGVVLGRNTADPARWKRYRGGTAGVLWIDAQGTGEFRKLIDLKGNLAAPMWVGDRVFFISDHEGVGNLYSCTSAGEDLQAHTHNRDYYVRNATSDGRRIVYHAGADLFCLDTETGSQNSIEIDFRSPQVQRQRKFVEAGEFLEDYTLHAEGHSTLVTSRGKSFYFGNWEGAVTPLNPTDGVRSRLTRWLNDQRRLVTIADRDGFEALEIHNPGVNLEVERLEELDLGRALSLEISPTEDKVVLSNHRQELVLVDLNTKQRQVLDASQYQRIHGFCWSPDGQWVAYSCAENQQTASIKICRIQDGSTYCLTPPRFKDIRPAFDPEGKFIYFLSYREFNPVYDSMYFDLGFPRGMRPFLIALKKETPSPFVPVPKPLKPGKANGKPEAKNGNGEDKQDEDKGNDKSVEKKIPTVEIDFDGIEHRVVGFPVPEGRYGQIWGVKGKALFTSLPIKGSLNGQADEEAEAESTLEFYDFEEQKRETIATEVTSFRVAKDNETVIYRSKKRLRICAIAPQDKNKNNDKHPGRKTGWLDLKRLRISVVPLPEWQQMLREIWRLQREHFWKEDMASLDWEQVYQRYAPLLSRVSTRSEFSDLVWEMQGELGTSHAYEYGGDYRKAPPYQVGFLGADFTYDSAADGYRVAHVVQGDSWQDKVDSPLHRLGVNVQVGDLLLAVNGQRVSRELPPQALLVHQADCEVTLTFAGAIPEEPRTVTVKTLGNETRARYREWVERNHQTVTEATNGRVGYVHVPDMGPSGYAEFHRYYFAEVQKEALVVDVRYNGGGHVSQLLLEKLARKRIGYDISRWGKPEPYPADSVLGPVVAITNEHAGSDGDIFSHCFKLMQLGTLIGKRTWGGVIGIWPRHALADGSVVTQPEFSFWFTDVGWSVENYGTDPDIEVEITPQAWGQDQDPQLERAIELVLEQLEQHPVQLPDFGPYPQLRLPG
ncbi:S41 family peptidase [Leptolyngbya sp. FACHB-261]|uniref:S41 family peptidase n=1 Tax=Leptolyngbya sp. FACHB-261 TaxID=2692806 RepID=UPI00168356EE|nr:S41 family peptidase [Leptolyngbya sp. FACHB-261]MBD2104719.1 PDZ domain-containing protein [Leptolyngbya sp. FACHB-261]